MIKTILICLCLLPLSCQKENHPDLLQIDSIKYDTSCGYPYPANYDWFGWVKSGKYPVIPSKNKESWEPLAQFMRSQDDELYRMVFGLLKCIVYADSSTKEIIIQKDSVLRWNNKSPWGFPDSIVKVTRKIALSKKEWNKTIALINNVRLFSKNTIDSTPRFIDDGYNWQLEGIKDQYYNLLFRVCPEKNYEKELYALGLWLLKKSGEYTTLK